MLRCSLALLLLFPVSQAIYARFNWLAASAPGSLPRKVTCSAPLWLAQPPPSSLQHNLRIVNCHQARRQSQQRAVVGGGGSASGASCRRWRATGALLPAALCVCRTPQRHLFECLVFNIR